MGIQRLYPAWNDLTGIMQSAAVGGTAWSFEFISDTLFLAGALRNASSDLVQVTIQVPHGRKLQSILASLHVHYVLQAANTLNDTVIWSGSYCWVSPGEAIPATVGWTALSGAGLTQNLGAVKPIRYYGIHNIITNIPAPSNEGYGGFLLIHLVRGTGTYTPNLTILGVDCHSQFDRLGSLNETTD
jgi:hypothetical protein